MKKLIISVLAAAMLPFTAVSAAVNDAAQQGAAIIVKGNIEKEKKGVFVTLVVAKSGVTADEISNAFDENVYYVDQTLSDENGDYCFYVYLPENTDEHEIYVKTGEGKYRTAEKDNIRYTAVSLIRDALENVNKAYYGNTSEDERKKAMLSAMEAESLALSDYAEYSDYNSLPDKNAVAEYMLLSVSKSRFTYETDEELNAAVQRLVSDWKKAVALSSVLQSENQSSMKEKFNTYADILGVNVTRLNAIESENEYFCDEIKRQNPKSVDELISAYNAACAFSDANSVLSWSVLKDIFTADAENLGINMGAGSSYNKLKDKDTFFKNFVKNVPFASLERLKEEFNTAVKKQLDSETAIIGAPSGGGSSSGGGGGGNKLGGAISPSVPVIVKTEDKAEASKKIFNDIEKAEWARESIEYLLEKGIVNGVDDDNFEPQRNITRAEFLKMIILAFEIQSSETAEKFNDVSSGDWYSDYAASGRSAGIISGDENGNFNPLVSVSRQDMAVMLYRCMQNSGYTFEDSKDTFDDFDDIKDYAKEAVSKLCSASILNGYDNNTFRPFGNATRAEASKMIYGGMMKRK